MTWPRGKDAIDGMLERQELERIPACTELAERLLDQARKALLVAHFAFNNEAHYSGYSDLYDGVRKAITAVLQIQGLRPTRQGGHIAVIEAATAQFEPVLGKLLRSADRMRALRNEYEYPDGNTYIDPDVAHSDLGKAGEIIQACEKLVDHGLPVFIP